MGKYGGMPGIYYYGKKSQAQSAARAARKAGFNARVKRWLDRAPGVPMWEVVVTRRKKRKVAKK